MRSLLVPVFLQGLGSALEIAPAASLFPFQRLNPDLSDGQRLASDWQRVGNAMRSAIAQVASTGSDSGEKEEPAERY